MQTYGSDKPDTRFGLELQALPEIDASAVGFVFSSHHWTSKQTQRLCDRFRLEHDTVVATIRMLEDGKYRSSEKLSRPYLAVRAGLDRIGARSGDTVIVAYKREACTKTAQEKMQKVLGLLRLEIGKQMQELGFVSIRSDQPQFLWITDFPLLEQNDQGHWCAVHHPFTAPQNSDLDQLLNGEFHGVRARSYDLVCNGVEVGGGSVRIHEERLQQFLFSDVLKMDGIAIQQCFGHLLESLRSGCPPHAGFALGVDRFVSLAVGPSRATSIRDVIAFPKSYAGHEAMTGSPTPVASSSLAEFGLRRI